MFPLRLGGGTQMLAASQGADYDSTICSQGLKKSRHAFSELRTQRDSGASSFASIRSDRALVSKAFANLLNQIQFPLILSDFPVLICRQRTNWRFDTNRREAEHDNELSPYSLTTTFQAGSTTASSPKASRCDRSQPPRQGLSSKPASIQAVPAVR